MQPDFKHNATPRRPHTGARPLGLRVRLGWIAVCLLAVCIAITFARPVLAADTGAKTATNIVSSGSWSNFTVGYLNASEDNRATNATNNNYGVVSTFAFGVPAGVQIDGIQVDVEGSNSKNNKTVNYEVQLSGNGGTVWTTARADTFTDDGDDTDTLGGASDDWGWTWGTTGFSDANFRLRIYRTGGTNDLRVDLIQVTVYYSVPSFTQASFRGRNDSGNETTATWKDVADTDWTQKVDENFRVRFVVQETAGIGAADKAFQLEYNRNGGGWNDVTGASSVVRAWASPNVGDGDNTTQQVGSGTFVTPNAGFDEADGLAGGTSLDFSGGDEVEVEYCVQISSMDVANDDTIQLRVKGLDAFTATPTVTVSGIPEFDQNSFQARNDDGNESAATWQASSNVDWTQIVDQNFRVRFVVQETGDGAAADQTFQLEYNLNGGGWNDVNSASSVVRATASPNVADGANTTQQVGSGTFVTPNAGFDEVNGQAGGTSLDFSGSDEVELEYCLQVRSADVSADDTIELRIKNLDSYSQTPTITAALSTPPAYDQDAFRARNDDGSESAATWQASSNVDWTQIVDQNFRVRFVVQETNGVSVANKTFQLEYNLNGGGWNDVSSASSVVRAWASPNVADSTDTTQQVGSGTYVTPNAGFDEANGQAGGASLDFSGSDEVELEFCLQIRSADVSNDDTIELRVKGLTTYTNSPTITVSGILEFVQAAFRARNNDGSETTATWKAAANTNWTEPVTTEYYGDHFRVRFLVQENGGVSAADKTFQLEYSHNGGAWNDVSGASSVIKAKASDNLTEAEDTTQQLGSGTFISDNDGVDETNGQAGGTMLDFAGGDEVELEFSLMIKGEDVVNNDIIQLRIKGLDTYSNTPTITVQDYTFNKYRKITIQSSKVGADLTNFPVMIKLTGADFQSIEDDVTDPDGDDIIFRESLGGNQLDHEIEVYDTSSDLLVAWVKVPSVSGSSNTDFYMYYGNAGITSSTQNAPGVWSNGYEAVYHLHDDWNDSTGSHNATGGQTQGYASGPIANGVDFEGSSSDYIDIGTWSVSGSALTMEAWVNYESFADKQTILDKSSATYSDWNLSTDKTGISYRARLVVSDSQLNGSTTFSTGTWYLVTGKYDGSVSTKYIRIDNTADTNSSQTGNLTVNTDTVRIGDNATGADQPFDGIIDEVRISSTSRSDDWLNTEYNNVSDPSTFYTLGSETPATVIDLIAFNATGEANQVRVDWQTAQEIRNLGFNLYRATSPAGPFEKINDRLIPGLIYSVKGKSYSYIDDDVTPGTLYYYKLEDIDASGKRTFHGPVCVDWDADGMPDDWEIANGLNPWVYDADIDADKDRLTNGQEYELGFDPFNPDSDGDGIPDGQEGYRIEREDTNGSRGLTRGVQVLASDESGVTLELHTESFDTEVVSVAGMEFERLRIADYIHGRTREVGRPEVPVKGIFLDLPEGQSARLSVLQTEVDTYDGYQVFPVPENVLDDQGTITAVGESFVWDQSAYAQNAFYPAAVACLGDGFVFRGQIKQQILFHPLSFNPATGTLRHYRKIRVRIDYEENALARTDTNSPTPWRLPAIHESSDRIAAAGQMAMAFGASPLMANPISPALSALGVLFSALWSPDMGAQGAAYKILVEEEGIYHLTRDYLAANGVDVDAMDLNQIRIYNLGSEIAIDVYDQNGDNSLDASDYIEFYGRAVPQAYAKYARDNVYWLVAAGGTGSPKRMAQIDGTPATGPLTATHNFTVHYEEDEYYVGLAPGDDSLDRWFFDDFVLGTDFTGTPDPVPTDFSVNLPGISGSGSIKISMWGYYDTYHEIEVRVNGNPAGIFNWTGIAFYEATIDPIDLLEGNNTISLACNRQLDGIIVDSFDISYPRTFEAVDNTLQFSHDSGFRYQLDGFNNSALMVFDITDATDVSRVANVAISGGNPYTMEFEPPANPGTTATYLVLASDAAMVPKGLIADNAADLAYTANGADYILITHRDLGWDAGGNPYGWLDDLVALREDQGLRVKVVDVQDIFDEFSYGITSAGAIRDFLSYAYNNWQPPAPQYILLVGDSSYDFRDNLQLGITNYVPAYLTFTQFMGETVTDEWFVTISGDDAVPDLYIGRLPAESEAEAAVMINKILAYETSLNDKTWQKNILLIADDQNEAYEAEFETMNEDAADLLPASMNAPFRGYLNDYLAASGLTNDIKARINAGALIVNYSGHGALQRWAGEKIFQISDVDDLTNADRYPFIVNMTCLTGYFGYLDPQDGPEPSLAEALIKADGKGAIASLMPTAMTSTGGQHILDTALFEAIFTKDIRQLGPAVADAKETLLANGGASYEEISKTFLLFGDPALALQVPLPHKPSGIEVERTEAGIMISWHPVADSGGNPVTGYNVYRSSTPGGIYTKINSELISETEFLDTDSGGVGASSVSGASGDAAYYGVTAVDDSGDESAQTLGSSPTGIIESATGSASGAASSAAGAVGCFISVAARSNSQIDLWLWVLMFIGLTIILCIKARSASPEV
jgi:hypothetical protein